MDDPTIDEVRRVRREISSEFGPDLTGMVERYAAMESKFKRSALTPKNRRTKDCTKVTDNVVSDGKSSPTTR